MASKFPKRKPHAPSVRRSNPRLMALLFQATRLLEGTKLSTEDLSPEEYSRIVSLYELVQEALKEFKTSATRKTRHRS
jgi:hypothetical protein